MSKSTKSILFFLILGVGIYIGKGIFMSPKYGGGEKAPTFSTTLIDGRVFALEDLRGKYVLLDFWGTWCGPCRAEFPMLKELNKKYSNASIPNADGFEIVSVALEREGARSEERTKQQIVKLGLDWEYHIFDPITNFKLLNAKIATELYGVREVPTKYLIAPDGSVAGVNMSFEEIEKTLNGK